MGNRDLLRYSLLGLTLATACADVGSDSDAVETTAAGARVVRSQSRALTAPSSAPVAAIATGFVSARALVAPTDLAVAAQVRGQDGVTHVRLTQTLDGLRVHGAYARVAISAQGEVIQSIDRLATPRGALVGPRVDAATALRAATTKLGYTAPRIDDLDRAGSTRRFDAGPEFYQAPTVETVAYITADGAVAVGFLVETWSRTGNRLDHTLVDGDGAVVSVERRTASDSYNVFVEDPGKGAQTVVAGPGAGNAESPSGWLAGSQTTINISGNNVHAYLDADANNAPDSGGTAVTTGNFTTAVDLGAAPSTTGNRAVAVQNLFYLNNIAHDTLYRHGFDEAAGNFQNNNFGAGGNGNDAVNAEAQDGGGTDNANFATPADGSAPRMQMYLWTGIAPDGVVDSGSDHFGLFASGFGSALTAAGTTGALAIYQDGTGVSTDGCETATVALTGKIALIDRGTCNFTVKVMNAQKAGAVAAIIVNNVAEGAFAPGGTDRKIRIPSGMVTLADGTTLSGRAGASVTLRSSPTTALQIDGDLDSDIVFHEYGHGLTWRMIGSMSGAMSGAIGEGASDVTAFLINGDDRIGEYAYSNSLGIRRYPYEGYPLTYSAVTGGEVHNDGEVYAAAMWRVLGNYLAAGLTADDLMGDWVDGMNFTPAGPAFEDMRDGMLQSVAGTGRECLIWRGFAATGIGVGATGTVNRRGQVSVTESFTLPASCQ